MKRRRNDQIIQVEEGVYLDSLHLYDLKQLICLVIDKAAEDEKNQISEEDMLVRDFSMGVGGRESMLISWLRKRQGVISISIMDAVLFEHIYRTIRSTCFSLFMRDLPIETQRRAFVQNLAWYCDITCEDEADPIPDACYCDTCAKPMVEGQMIEKIKLGPGYQPIRQDSFCANCGRGFSPVLTARM